MTLATNTHRQEQRRVALYALLHTIDLPDLRDHRGRQRGHRWTVERDPKRDPDIVKRDLGTAYVTHRRQDHGPDISCIIDVYQTPTLRLVVNDD